MRVEWSAHAVVDLMTISEYIQRDRSLDAANSACRKIYQAVQELVTTPSLGRVGRVEGTRELVVAPLPYVVIYQVFSERLLVLNIVHEAQRWP